jgi:hypothetical protein
MRVYRFIYKDTLIFVSEDSTSMTMDLPPTRPRHRKLPAELNSQIFLCFNPATQRKFIWGLGWDFYAMFRHRLLTKVFMKYGLRPTDLKGKNQINFSIQFSLVSFGA